jgi:hypothetical protein
MKLFVMSDVLYLQFYVVLTVSLSKTTVSKAVLNGLGTYSLPTIGNELCFCEGSVHALTSIAVDDYVSRFS